MPIYNSSKTKENGGGSRKVVFNVGKEYFKIQGYVCKEQRKNGEFYLINNIVFHCKKIVSYSELFPLKLIYVVSSYFIRIW